MRPNLVKLIKECIEEVLRENLSEGFDPTSQGPNPVQDNPYPAWNSEMRKLEEDGDKKKLRPDAEKVISKAEAWVAKKKAEGWTQKDFAAGLKKLLMGKKPLKETDPHGNYAKDAGAGQFDPRTFGPTTKIPEL